MLLLGAGSVGALTLGVTVGAQRSEHGDGSSGCQPLFDAAYVESLPEAEQRTIIAFMERPTAALKTDARARAALPGIDLRALPVVRSMAFGGPWTMPWGDPTFAGRLGVDEIVATGTVEGLTFSEEGNTVHVRLGDVWRGKATTGDLIDVGSPFDVNVSIATASECQLAVVALQGIDPSIRATPS